MRSRGLSLEQKVPLLITALLVGFLSLTVAFAYREVRSSALRAEVERLDRLAMQLADSYRSSIAQRVELIEAVADLESIHRFLLGTRFEQPGDSAEVAAALEEIRLQGGVRTRAALLDATGRIVQSSGSGTREELQRLLDREWERADESGVLAFEGQASRLTVRTPVLRDGRLHGHLVQSRPFGNPTAADQISEIIGADAMVYLGDGRGAWAALDGTAHPGRSWTAGPSEYTFGAQGYLAHMTTLAGTPWQVAIERPLNAVFQRPATFLRRIAGLLVVMIGLGGLTAWYLSRTFTHPLRILTEAAESVANGDYGHRVDLDRADELGTLAASFNSMAGQVQTAHVDLQFQVEQARELAIELERANRRLRNLMVDAENARLLAEEANRAKSDFLATVSHEIRTPINAIVGYTDLMLLGIGGKPSPAQIENLERVRGNGKHLTRLIDDVLDLAKIEAGQLHVGREVGVAEEALENALAMILPLAQDRGVELIRQWELGTSTLYLGDPGRVEQILVNLITNAVKFTPEGGEVTLSCDCGSPETHFEDEAFIHLRIDDTGVGIPSEKHEAIFERFVQGEGGYKRSHGGAGLGLAISRELARLMGGEITVESRPARGSRFTLLLRRHRLPAGETLSA